MPTEFGTFKAVTFRGLSDGREHIALVRGEVAGRSDVPIRMHSECLTGDALGSMRCDCRAQLMHALRALGESDSGVLLYLRQEGRGIGLVNKLRAYELQDGGQDTVEANHALGFADDERRYGGAAEMLQALGVTSVRLMTNNPKKIAGLTDHGVLVTGRIPHEMPATPHNLFYLKTKAARSGHMLEGLGAS